MIRELAFTLPLVLLAAVNYDPTTLTLIFSDGHQEAVTTTSPAKCQEAVRAIAETRTWPASNLYDGSRPLGDRVTYARCDRGGSFEWCSQFIIGFNAPPECGR